ncbi:MAG TPA: sulfurtransferase complex subunit TusB [Gammaproteobacteria bacterium]|nr:sulfurtransferase complex subunit TusB [Gammaproteobacteria bacterium]
MLHIVNQSPFERDSLASCLTLSLPGAGILLIEDAVVAVRTGSRVAEDLLAAMTDRHIYALGPDLDARGIARDTILPGIRCVDYAGFVQLTTEHNTLQSWL